MLYYSPHDRFAETFSEGKTEAGVMAFEEVAGQIFGALMNQKQNEAYNAKYNELKEKYVQK